MTEENKQIGKQIWEEIQKANNILLHLHPSPDGDSAGSALAMMHVLKSLGKNVTLIAGDSELPRSFRYLPGYENIVEKKYGEVELKDFDLFLIQDSASKDRVTREVEPVEFPEGLQTIVIDHHNTNPKYGNINLVESSSPATAQILYELFEMWNITLTKEIALNLFFGMFTDTGGFRYRATTPETLSYASKLVVLAPDYPDMLAKMENTLEPENLTFMSLALSSLELYFSKKVAIAPVSFEVLAEHGIQKKHTQRMELSNTLRMVEGWEMGISAIESEKDKMNVSIRTQSDVFDVSKLAAALGGGGHKMAAGAQIRKPFKEAKEFLLKTIAEVYPELGNA